MGREAELLTRTLQSKISSGVVADIPALVRDLEEQGVDPGEAFEQLLNDPRSFDWHYYAVAGMRTLAELDRLRHDQAKLLLDRTEHLAWQLGTEEFYKSIGAVARSREAAPALIAFVQKRLLDKQDLRDWRWLAFAAIAAIVQSNTALIPASLKERLGEEVENEPDQGRQLQLREFVKTLRYGERSRARGRERVSHIEYLTRVPVFHDLPRKVLERIARSAKERIYEPDTTILKQGERGTAFYLIIEGQVEVLHNREHIRYLSPGDFFGEMDLLEDRPRVATVIARRRTRCLELPGFDFRALIREDPEIAPGTLERIIDLLRNYPTIS